MCAVDSVHKKQSTMLTVVVLYLNNRQVEAEWEVYCIQLTSAAIGDQENRARWKRSKCYESERKVASVCVDKVCRISFIYELFCSICYGITMFHRSCTYKVCEFTFDCLLQRQQSDCLLYTKLSWLITFQLW